MEMFKKCDCEVYEYPLIHNRFVFVFNDITDDVRSITVLQQKNYRENPVAIATFHNMTLEEMLTIILEFKNGGVSDVIKNLIHQAVQS